ncbi:MAG: DUF3108 domain-containing protein [Acidobacteria bacterium]|nr:DUF3108 domain-containing protein [Acidobacteriota bacterium]MBS1866442.1 DUF3108 domain-containing protein [Acidobacteriota bacterium]
MSGRISLLLAIVAAILFAGAAFLWLHFRAGSSQPVVAFTPIAHATEPAKEAPVESAKTSSTGQPSEPIAKKTPLAEPLFSPKAGEVLQFSASLAKVSNVASLRLEVVDKKETNGKATWHFQATAKTQNAMRLIFDLDDRFDSFSDANSFTGVQYEMHLNERGQKVQSVQRLTTTGKEPSTAGVSSAVVLPGTRDPLGMMQYLRSVNWDQVRDVKSPVFDGRKLYDVRAKLIGTSEVVVPAGKFTAATIEIRVFDNGAEMKDAHFTLYLAQDPGRTPVLLLATLPFAEARVELQEKSE